MVIAQRTSPPFRAEHIGSLRRPDELIQKRLAFDAGKCTKEELQECEDRAIKDIVQMQRDVGLKTITDGEFRRRIFFEGFWGSLEGMTFVPQCPPERFSQLGASRRTETSPSWICTGKLKRTKPVYGPQFEGLKKFVTQDEIPRLKMTICAPEFLYIIHREHTFEKGVYNDVEEYFADMVKINREEIADLYTRGCRNLQIDDPWLTFLADGATVKRMQAAGINIDAELSRFIRLLNDCLEGRPKDMTVGVHLCRGNRKDGEWFAEGSYETIAVRLFNELNVDVYYLEYDTQRAGTFEPLRFFPPDKFIVLGIITTKSPQLEDPDEMVAKVHDAARHIATGQKRPYEAVLDQICISPQCGFASSWEGNCKVSDLDMRHKLQLLDKVSKMVWGKNQTDM